MSKDLFVHVGGAFVGVYSQSNGGATTFSYDDDYVNRANPTPLSMSLPLESSRYSSRAVNSYFAGLVPEGAEALRQISDRYSLRGNPSPFSILTHLTPSEYSEFRGYLGNASGFQPYQIAVTRMLLIRFDASPPRTSAAPKMRAPPRPTVSVSTRDNLRHCSH